MPFNEEDRLISWLRDLQDESSPAVARVKNSMRLRLRDIYKEQRKDDVSSNVR